MTIHSPAALIGLFSLVLALLSFSAGFQIARQDNKKVKEYKKLLALIQSFVGVFVFAQAGIILTFQGWRLDPILLYAVFLIYCFCTLQVVFDYVTSKNR